MSDIFAHGLFAPSLGQDDLDLRPSTPYAVFLLRMLFCFVLAELAGARGCAYIATICMYFAPPSGLSPNEPPLLAMSANMHSPLFFATLVERPMAPSQTLFSELWVLRVTGGETRQSCFMMRLCRPGCIPGGGLPRAEKSKRKIGGLFFGYHEFVTSYHELHVLPRALFSSSGSFDNGLVGGWR